MKAVTLKEILPFEQYEICGRDFVRCSSPKGSAAVLLWMSI